jgi:hypothetical protein
MQKIIVHNTEYLHTRKFSRSSRKQQTTLQITSKGLLILWRQAEIYATLIAGTVEAEGAEASRAGVLEEGIDDPGATVEEAIGGRIRDTILGAYPFAFFKNSVISTKGIAYEAPTFS